MSTSALRAPTHRVPQDLNAAIQTLTRFVEVQRGGDQRYLTNQMPRYARTMARIQTLCPDRCRVLDIGSHYLHQSVLLRELGHEVTGIDIGLFANAPFLKERALAFGIRNSAVDALEAGTFLPGHEGQFDLIVFTEILEHITFNPIRLWQRIHQLMSPTGMVYLSTPNALRPAAWLKSLLALLSFRGIGLQVEEIMDNVTYGHHWKEYSSWEIKRYFALLSPDFEVTTRWYSSDLEQSQGLKTQLKKVVALVPPFRSDIEALIRRTGNAGFTAQAPELQMQKQAQGTSATDAAKQEA